MKNNNKKELAIILAATMSTGVLTANTVSKYKNLEIQNIEENKNAIIEKYDLKLKERDENIKGINKKLKDVNKELKDVKKQNEELRKELSSLVKMELTYYTTLPQENGGYTTTAIQSKLRHGVVASNYYPIGTKILIEGTVYTVEDRGSSSFNSPHRLDVLVERRYGESDASYFKRVNDMGKKKVHAKILK